jgi:hypothetical protein
LSSWSGKQVRRHTGTIRPLIGSALIAALLPIRLFAAPGTLGPAAQQHPVTQYCTGCHNHEAYTGGVELASPNMFDIQADHFGDSTGPLQNS